VAGVLGLAIVIVIAVFNAGSVFGLATGGDPGGRILGELKPAALAVPDDAKIRYRHDVEPKWDSCDGRQGTFGWDDVVLQIHFSSASASEAVSKHVDVTLRGLGWVANYNNGMQLGWTKVLANKTTAHAQLSGDQPIDPGTWTLFVSAPPVGQRVSGC
jgi:hypothetical protein